MRYHDCEVVSALGNFNVLQALWMALRMIPMAAIGCGVILFQGYIRPHVRAG